MWHVASIGLGFVYWCYSVCSIYSSVQCCVSCLTDNGENIGVGWPLCLQLLVLLLICLAKPCNLQDMSSLTTDWTQPLAVKARSRRGSVKKCFQNTRLKTFQPLPHLPSDESRLSSVAEVGLPLLSGAFMWRETLWGQNVLTALSCIAPHHFWVLNVFICLLLCFHAVSFCDKRRTPFLLGGRRVTVREVGIQDHQCGTVSSQYHLIFVQCLFRGEPEQCEGEGLEWPTCWEVSSA